jgi:hypothetical protein
MIAPAPENRPESGRLVTTRVKFPPEAPPVGQNADKTLRANTKARVYSAREIARRMHRPNSNQVKCGRVRINSEVELRKRDGSGYYFRGLVTCGSVWTCPVCSWKIATGRGHEVQSVIDQHLKTGGGVYLITATIPHDQGDDLKPLRTAVSNAWRKTISGRAWLRMKQRIGFEGFIRALEVTHGVNGWHPHLHLLFFTKKPLPSTEAAILRLFLFERWNRAITCAGYRPTTPEHGLTIEHGHRAGHYVAKVASGLVSEVTQSAGKSGRGGSRTPLQILEAIGETDQQADRRLWREWLTGIYGARQLTYSRSIREKYLRAGSPTDTELAGDKNQDEADTLVLSLPAAVWDRLIRADRSFTSKAIALLDLKGCEAFCAFIARVLPDP